MKKQEELLREISELIKETNNGTIRWDIIVQTTEGNEEAEKPVEEEGGTRWTIDECFVSYYCKFKGQDFSMITYELIKKSGDRIVTSNMVFLPPLGIRFFDLRTLLPYSVQASSVLLSQIHNLWVQLMDLYKVDKGSIYLDVREGTLTIDD